MKLFLSDQSGRFREHLDYLKAQPVMQYNPELMREKTTVIDLDTDNHFLQRCAKPLFEYRIFPPHIMSCLTEWDAAGRAIQAGDTILQQVFLPPVREFSQKLIFGVRVRSVIREETRLGFSYETLEGHVEKGISTFTIETASSGSLIFKIHTLSKPGNFLSTLLGPVFSVPYQAYCTKAALEHVKRQLHSEKI